MNNDKNNDLPQKRSKAKTLPNVAIEQVPKGVPSSIMDIQDQLLEMAKRGRVQTAEEMLERYNYARKIFKENDLRCGIESVALCLGVSRQTLWNWERGYGCDSGMQMVAKMIKQANASYLETLMLSGKVSPPVGIFALKCMSNWVEPTSEPTSEPTKKSLTVKDLKNLDALIKGDNGSNNDNNEDYI